VSGIMSGGGIRRSNMNATAEAFGAT